MSPAVATTMVLGLVVEVEALSCLDCPQATNKGLIAKNKNNFFIVIPLSLISVYYITKQLKYLRERETWVLTYAGALPFLTILW